MGMSINVHILAYFLGTDSVTVVNGVRVRNRKVAVLQPTVVLRKD